jgi:glycosyltransferase involved in cell wall biosynthesis
LWNVRIMTGPFEFPNPLLDERLISAKIKNPFVTVIVTNYNYEKYIIHCLESVAMQKYPLFKCVIVDDYSSDGSINLIEDFIKSDLSQGRFELVRREENGGQMEAFKTGLRHAEGGFVLLLDADDILFEDFLSVHIHAHMGPKAVAFTSSNQYQINENNEIIAGIHPDLLIRNRLRYIKPRPLHRPFWIWATTSSMMFRKPILDLIMPDGTDPFRVCADNYICHFANIIGGSMLIPTVHGCYRRHGSNYFSSNPFLGARLPTGNMDEHPKHHIVRLTILSHILKNHEKFSALLAEGNFITTLLRLTGPIEIFRIKKNYPEYFKKKPFSLQIRFLIAGFLMRINQLIAEYVRYIQYIFHENKRRDPDI